MDFTKRTIFKIFAKKRAASKGRFYTFRRNITRSVGTLHGSLARMLGVVLLAANLPRLHTPRTCTKTAF